MTIAACAALWVPYAAAVALGYDGLVVDVARYAILGACIVLCVARAFVADERLPWAVLAGGLLVWVAADVYYTVAEPASYPSIADAGWLLIYPVAYAALWLVVRNRLRIRDAGLWLDGLLGGLAVAALGAALVFEPIVNAGSGSPTAVATNLAYPIGDLLLAVFIVGAIGLTGWRPGRGLLLFGAGLAVGAIGDCWFLYLVATDSYHGSGLVDTLWPLALLLVATAAWQPPPPPQIAATYDGWRVLLLPTAFMCAALAIYVFDHFWPVFDIAIWLATAALVVGIARMALIFRDNIRMLVESRREARIDALTGLRNRRALLADLDAELDVASFTYPRVLALFDLDGFKGYNDSFGHAAGDELLARFGQRLDASMGDEGGAYRLGGDEFCVLARTETDGSATLLASAAKALSSEGEGFAITCSYGAVVLPLEANDAASALLLADRRMYADKHGGRDPAGRRTQEVRMASLHESDPDINEHVEGVAKLALAVAERLGMPEGDSRDVARAAELHDIGKIAIPDSILGKSSALDQAEWDFMRRHTVIGERILASAPAMEAVSKLVRSSHERWDGNGYPDRLAGTDIPLGARIVSVCDAYEAMVSDRPYRTGISPSEALAELRRCAGTQFDPDVVEAFAALPDWARHAQPVRVT
jgi:diguanylate cyclase (GGDEF)-like protein